MFPSLQAIWLLDSVRQDEATGKVSLAGLFDRINVPEGADYTEGASIFFAVRNVRGRVRLKLIYTDLRDDAVLLERTVVVDGGPLETTDVTVRVNRIPVPHPGTYAWEVYYGPTLLGTTRVEVTVGGDS